MKSIVVNHTSYETRVAVLENKHVVELFYERPQDKGNVGNIYRGRVQKILPGMEAAFVDIGSERSAFLYVDDIGQSQRNQYDIVVDTADQKPFVSRAERPAIQSLIKEGQEILVQISKGAIGTKGARVTTSISLPGRNLVFLPHADMIGISRYIFSGEERQRLKRIVQKIKPDPSGVIIRTVAESRSDEDICTDLNYLVSTWHDIQENFDSQKPPVMVHEDLDILFRIVRDVLAPDIDHLVIDDPIQFAKIKLFISKYMPRYLPILSLYKRKVPIFDYYGVEYGIDSILNRKISLPSGGFLMFDHTEALTAIDVNTGRFVGADNHEQTILKTNLEAVEQIVSQVQLRNIGGIIIIDFIDMESSESRDRVYRALKEELKSDKARSRILQISEMGLVEMTRKRDRENLARYLSDPCPHCNGNGIIKSPATISHEIMRELDRYQPERQNGSLSIMLHPDVYDYLVHQTNLIQEKQKEIPIQLTFQAQPTFHHEQFELCPY